VRSGTHSALNTITYSGMTPPRSAVAATTFHPLHERR
jgi:hypothetical protein